MPIAGSQKLRRAAAADPSVSPKLTLVDGAQGTAHITADPQTSFWAVVEERLAAAHVTARQVEAVWVKPCA